MFFKLLLKVVVPVALVLLFYIALNSQNIPEDDRNKAYLVMGGFFILIAISSVLSTVLKYASSALVIAGVVLLLYFLYTYNALPFIDKSIIDNARVEVGV